MPATAAAGDLCAAIDHAKLRAWREAAGLTREQVAVCAGIGYPLLCAIEYGNRRPRRDMLTRLAMLYGHDPAELLAAADGPR
jgi:transcriptional regulator with XRE-family HTH domain